MINGESMEASLMMRQTEVDESISKVSIDIQGGEKAVIAMLTSVFVGEIRQGDSRLIKCVQCAMEMALKIEKSSNSFIIINRGHEADEGINS